MKTIYLIVAVDRRELKEHLKKHRQLDGCTRLEVIKHYCKTQVVYAVTTLTDALADCRSWNRRTEASVHYWEKIPLYK